jgi:hypothetical protein
MTTTNNDDDKQQQRRRRTMTTTTNNDDQRPLSPLVLHARNLSLPLPKQMRQPLPLLPLPSCTLQRSTSAV